MRVDNESDRSESPEECDNCGSMVGLHRFCHYGPGWNVEWLCVYCIVDHTHGESSVVKSIAAMFNVLEKRLKK